MLSGEKLHQFVKERPFSLNERSLAELMFSHWDQIDVMLGENNNRPLHEPRYVMDFREIKANNGEGVVVIAGLLPAVDEGGRPIIDMRATPSLFCIPKELLGAEQQSLFNREIEDNAERNVAREQLVKEMVEDQGRLKLYNLHGWGANPYVFAKPMADLAVKFNGIGVLAGLMGSMGTTRQDINPFKFGKRSKYDWESIRAQARGVIYSLEGVEAVIGKRRKKGDKYRRVIVGHSMQGRTALRLLIDDLASLPETYFVSVTPLMMGGEGEGKGIQKLWKYLHGGAKRHVELGYDFKGLVMRAELGIIGRVGAEKRARFLEDGLKNIPFWIVNFIVSQYTRPCEPCTEELLVLAHLLEYLENPWAIMRQTRLLDGAPPAASTTTRKLMRDLVDRFMLVYAGQDPVLDPNMLMELLGEVGEGVDIKAYLASGDSHYLKQRSWDMLAKYINQWAFGVREFDSQQEKQTI